jgi:cytochrome P450
MDPFFELQTSEVRADPHALWRRLRAESPVLWSDRLGAWLVFRYADVASLLRDPRVSSRRVGAIMAGERPDEAMAAFGRAISRWMLFLDPPDHTRLRSLVNRAFVPRAVEAMRTSIETVVDELLGAVAAGRRMDLIQDLAYPLPTIVIANMLGAGRADRDHFKRWSDDLAAFFGNRATGHAGGAAAARSHGEMTARLRAVVTERRRAPSGDLIGTLIAAEEAGSVLTEEELLATCVLLLFAGHETTTHLIGNGVLALLRHPDALRTLRATPALIGTAVDELLRFDGPVQSMSRMAIEDIRLGDALVRKGDRLMLVLGAANRDPEHFPAPDELDVSRSENRHLAFGLGAHFCIGAPLARLEAQIAIGRLLDRFPSLALATGSVEWLPNPTFPHGLKALPLSF